MDSKNSMQSRSSQPPHKPPPNDSIFTLFETTLKPFFGMPNWKLALLSSIFLAVILSLIRFRKSSLLNRKMAAPFTCYALLSTSQLFIVNSFIFPKVFPHKLDALTCLLLIVLGFVIEFFKRELARLDEDEISEEAAAVADNKRSEDVAAAVTVAAAVADDERSEDVVTAVVAADAVAVTVADDEISEEAAVDAVTDDERSKDVAAVTADVADDEISEEVADVADVADDEISEEVADDAVVAILEERLKEARLEEAEAHLFLNTLFQEEDMISE